VESERAIASVKILIADDDKITRALLSRWSKRWGYEVVTAEDGEEAYELLIADEEIQICVLDWLMPKMSGPEVCKKLRAARTEPYVYTTLLTSKTETDDVVEGLQAGADDYIHKPCHPLELEVRLRVGRRLVELQQRVIQTREELRFEASHDGLTHLLNRRAIMHRLEKELVVAQAGGGPVSVVMMDLDHFKSVNDTHGHQAGDAVLREIPRRLASVLRENDYPGRYGGEEFLIVLADCGIHSAVEIARRVRKEIAEKPVSIDRGALQVTASLGVASTEFAANLDVDMLIKAADAALYRSKEAGRNRVTNADLRAFGSSGLSSAGSAA